jgi:hypothetical protein
MNDVIADPSGASCDELSGACDALAMADVFDYTPHPHIERRKAVGPPPTTAAIAATVHGPGLIGRINAKVGLGVTLIVGTMWCAYLFTVLALVSAPSAFQSGQKLVIVSWIAQTFLQLVLLPIIIVGQNVQGKASDARSLATYNDATALLEEARQIQAHLAAQDALSTKIQAHLETQDAAISKILAQVAAAGG